MHVGKLCCLDDIVRICVLAEAGDILGNRTGKEFHALRQIAEVATQRIGIPMLEFGTVDTDGTCGRRPDADKSTHETGLASPARPTIATASPGFTSMETL